MQLTKTFFPNSAVFNEKKWVENRLWRKSAFLWGGKIVSSQHGCKFMQPVQDLYKTDKQAFLYGCIDNDDQVYVRPPDWWFEPIPEGHAFRLKKAVSRIEQAALQ